MNRNRAAGAIAFTLVLGACGADASLDKNAARRELDQMNVPNSYERIDEGEVTSGVQTFQYVLYAAPEIRSVSPRGSGYEKRNPSPSFRRGWTILQAWNGLTSDRNRECLIVVEKP